MTDVMDHHIYRENITRAAEMAASREWLDEYFAGEDALRQGPRRAIVLGTTALTTSLARMTAHV